MRFQKQLWIAALCMSSASLITVSLWPRPAVHAERPPVSTPTRPSESGAHILNASLRAAAVSDAVLMDTDTASPRVSIKVQRNANPYVPPVEEFTLTPPYPAQHIYKTTLSVRFESSSFDKMGSQIPFDLAGQGVVLERSAADPTVFSTHVDFNWEAFAKEQQRRKQLAATGRQIPVFQGHRFVRMDNVEFVDPAEIRGALQSHEPIRFSAKVIEGTGTNVDPHTELMIIDPTIVSDTSLTWDPCTQQGAKMGNWTFGHLIQALLPPGATQQQAESLVQKLFSLFENNQNVNTFTVNARTETAVNSFLVGWGSDGSFPNIANATFQLNAIVNRIDLGQGLNNNAGELRFVFGATSCPNGIGGGGEGGADLFNVILEYSVPFALCDWTQDWENLEAIFTNPSQCNSSFPCAAFDSALAAMTESVAGVGAGKNNLVNLRTNEAQFVGGAPDTEHWEMRAFALNTPLSCGQQPPAFCQVPLQQTPQGDPKGTDYGMSYSNPSFFICGGAPTCDAGIVTAFINDPNNTINFPGTYVVPNIYDGVNFAGGSAFNSFNAQRDGLPFWNGTSGGQDPILRSDFSANTCNGCHGRETEVAFQQIVNTQRPAAAGLSGFLVGCTAGTLTEPCPTSNLCPLPNNPNGLACLEQVQDPVLGAAQTNHFGDIARRKTYFSSVISGCTSDGVLQSLVQHPVNFVH